MFNVERSELKKVFLSSVLCPPSSGFFKPPANRLQLVQRQGGSRLPLHGPIEPSPKFLALRHAGLNKLPEFFVFGFNYFKAGHK